MLYLGYIHLCPSMGHKKMVPEGAVALSGAGGPEQADQPPEHQALRSRQVLEEINDFNNLDPESEEEPGSNDDLDDEDSTFSFLSVALNAKAHTHAGTAEPGNQCVPPMLTPWIHHVPPPMASVQGLRPLNLTVPNTVLSGPGGHGMPTPLSGGPADLPPGTRFNAWTGMFDSISDISSHELTAANQHSSPSPFAQIPGTQSLKRPAPALGMAEGLQVVQKVKLGDGGSQAVSHYQCILTNSLIYLNDVVECRDWSAEAWNAACCANGVKVEYDEDAYKLITSRGSNLRSELKNLMRPLVEANFGFVNEKTPVIVKVNATLAAAVVENRKILMYKDCQACKGAYETDIILKGMIKWCYDKKSSTGVKYPTYFKDAESGSTMFGIVVALLTVVEVCLMEWITGTRVIKKFNKEQYVSMFGAHYELLVHFHEGTKQANIVPKICKRLLKHACRHASVPDDPIAAGSIQQFTMDESAAAAAEWECREESDSEGDKM
ncbi:uncharacterized protein EDB93DRAFT_1252986 [Suillus bovinus]|uniref:uncharacterized protein n=1 Tax=Suillus bovinus TaxID=48563 RepID=UPI001B866292|nr:uncharacterized protein EDB93DRAFT_1252986 [Suillus bovinus]KAG2139864.1 hypothetical protein EDB93DRAFT_1252986 [Suillus bovinus]